MEYLLDTDTCISYLRDKFNVARKIEAVGIQNCYVSEITIAELTFGAFHSKNYEKHITEVKKIELLYDVVPIYPSIALYAQERSRLRKDGQLIPDFDLLIGVTSVVHGMVMVTSNVKHLQRIASIKIENWRDKTHNEYL